MARSRIEPLLLACLTELEPEATFSVHGSRVDSSLGKSYFAKVGTPRETEQIIGEAESLKAMHSAAPGLAPLLLALEVVDEAGKPSSTVAGRAYFLSEYKDMSGLTNASAAVLGKRLATEMHAYRSQKGFGFAVPTYCGATRFANGWHARWEDCFDAKVEEMLEYLRGNGKYAALCRKGQELRKRVIPHLLGSLEIEPVLLHGDLWSGNAGTDNATGEPVIFDAASYYGHNEADLGIARMFGGFPQAFFKAYHDHLPKSQPEDQYELRAQLYELFHHLNHTVLFGGGYASGAMRLIETLLKACP